jgi:hypothetical protein
MVRMRAKLAKTRGRAQPLDARRFAFSILANGGNYRKIADIFLWNDIKLPCRTAIYSAQHEFTDAIKQECLALCQKWKAEMTDPSVVAFDGSWSHRRGAKECVVVLIDCRTKRIVDFEIVLKTKAGVMGNWDGSSNGMELQGLKELIKRWKDDPNVKGVVHDNDSKATKAIRDSGWKVDQYYDPNHVCKAFKRKWDTLPHRALTGIGTKLLRWFQYLIRSDFTPEERAEYWLNVVEHFKGNHEHCPFEHPTLTAWRGITDANAEAELMAFLEATVDLVCRTRSPFDSQMCESFNAVKAKFASKTISWKVSWPARVMCAVMQVNSDEDWRLPLAEKLGIRLSPQAKATIAENYRKQMALNAERRTEEYQKATREHRAAHRGAEQRNQVGASDYHMPPGVRGPGAPAPRHPAAAAAVPLIPYERAVQEDPALAEFDAAPIEDTEANPYWRPPTGQPYRLVPAHRLPLVSSPVIESAERENPQLQAMMDSFLEGVVHPMVCVPIEEGNLTAAERAEDEAREQELDRLEAEGRELDEPECEGTPIANVYSWHVDRENTLTLGFGEDAEGGPQDGHATHRPFFIDMSAFDPRHPLPLMRFDSQ